MSQSSPVYSPDGRHLWDGQQWVPIASGTSATLLPSRPPAAPWYRMQIASPGMVMILLVIFGLLGWGIVSQAQADDENSQRADQRACYRFSEDISQCWTGVPSRQLLSPSPA
ncbi:hypothetical protein [Kineococcus rubinsiae]|uniref:hypothetical protein n=1 Tax=Kineococcus rubinsiae TaxID=2609562 RepID=UPI001430BC8E|nr:hypothetical protein [Kineococcus rubinsiae]NIZ90784.1 hypothetical protein [Kineococcus rubinsiae]